MYQSEYIVSYDHGTSGVKAALISLDGMLIDYATEVYPLYQEQPRHAEQNPEDYWAAICRATAKVMEKTQADPKLAKGLVFAAIWKSIIPVDENIRPLRRSLIWLDSRAVEEAEEINRQLGENLYLPSDYWAKLYWFYKNEREIYDKAYKIIGVNTYFGWKTTGNLVTNVSDSFVFGHDAEQQAVYDRVLDWFGLDKNKFVPSVACSAEIGKLHAAAAAELGLVEGIPVFAGAVKPMLPDIVPYPRHQEGIGAAENQHPAQIRGGDGGDGILHQLDFRTHSFQGGLLRVDALPLALFAPAEHRKGRQLHDGFRLPPA